ncbi:pancreatic secretory granule membrane major glycoprotein GP2-like isoform X3 [Oculina patagonica]
MPTDCVDTMRCGAQAPGWLYGGHPKAAEGVANRSVCFHWHHKCCYYKTDIQVKNCRGFFVYKFKMPPMINLRYCGNGTINQTGSKYQVCKRKSEEERNNPCLSGDYIKLSEPDRAAGYLTKGPGECDRTDLNEEEAWYRFTGKAGTLMANKCVPVRRCGTNAPGWLNGSHPQDEKEGEVNRTVCFHWKNDCCHWRTQIKVRYCGEFFLYYLKRDPWGGCSYRYCGNGKGPTPTVTPSTKVSTEVTGTTKPSIITPPVSGVKVTCGKDEMNISIPKNLLHGLDREHLRLTDVNCGATETSTHFILHTRLTECHTTSRHTKDFVCYMNKVEEIPVEHHQIITRVREVEIPFSCYYSNMGVVSAVGLEVKSKKIIFSKKGYGEFVLEMKIFPNNQFIGDYKKKDFPVYVPLRKILFVEVSVDTEDSRLKILAEECFATPDPDPNKAGLKYTFIEDGCATDDTVKFIPAADRRTQRFSLEAFKFLGDHQFVYMHCKVKICNATDPNSRCAQGCLADRRKRSLYTQEANDEEYNLAQGPFMRKEEDNKETNLQEIAEELHSLDIKDQKSSPLIFASSMVGVMCLLGVSYIAWSKKTRARVRGYLPLALTQTKID